MWKEFTPIPGEIYFDQEELEFGKSFGSGFIVIEPNTPKQKSVSVNKQWPLDRWQRVCDQLIQDGYSVKQFAHSGEPILRGAQPIKTPTFRKALAVLRHSKMFLGHEGGMHHGAAAVGIPAVVLFGGFIHPRTTGYESHANIFTGGEEGCGSLHRCEHCLEAMQAISVEMVLREAKRFL